MKLNKSKIAEEAINLGLQLRLGFQVTLKPSYPLPYEILSPREVQDLLCAGPPICVFRGTLRECECYLKGYDRAKS